MFNWTVRVGENHLWNDDVTQEDLKPEKIIIHPDRNGEQKPSLTFLKTVEQKQCIFLQHDKFHRSEISVKFVRTMIVTQFYLCAKLYERICLQTKAIEKNQVV